METTIFVLQVLIFAFLIVAYFYIKNLLPSYFSEKGKNLATKEDIEVITEKIKTVESKIKIKESGEIDYNSLKRKTILDFFGTYNNWERLITGSYCNSSDQSESKNEVTVQKINDAKFAYNLKEGEIEIFIEDNQFYHLRKDVSIHLLKMQHAFEIYCTDIDLIIKTETDYIIRSQKVRAIMSSYNTDSLQKMRELMPHRNKLILYLEKILKDSFK